MIKTVFTLIEKDGKYLLVLEATGQSKSFWSMPGGHIDEGETMEAAAVRETKEEAGVDIELEGKIFTKELPGLEYMGKLSENDQTIEVNVYKGKLTGGELKSGPDEFNAAWLTPNEIKNLPLRFKFILELI